MSAEEVYQQVICHIRNCVPEPAILESIFNISLASIEYERNNLRAAERLVDSGIDAARAGRRTNSIAFGLTIRAYICLASAHRRPENLSQAQAAIETAVEYIQRHKLYPRTASQVYTCRVATWLTAGNMEKAQAWMQGVLPSPEELLPFHKELEHIAAAQVLLALRRYEEASSLLDRLSHQAQSGKRFGRWLKITILHALALHGFGNDGEAMGMLESCLVFARKEGYKRIFLDEGEPMQALIRCGLQVHSWSGPEAFYAEQLLREF